MGAYSLVDHQVRKKLDEMLKTWKNPVPGSTDKRPVFPVEITRTIETALIKARTAAVERQQQDQRVDMLRQRAVAMAPTTAWLKSSTPPQNIGHYPPAPANGYVQSPVPNGQFPVRSPKLSQKCASNQILGISSISTILSVHATSTYSCSLSAATSDAGNSPASARCTFTSPRH